MVRICAWCKRFLGFKGSIFSIILRLIFCRLEITHGICPKCLEAMLEEEKKQIGLGPPE